MVKIINPITELERRRKISETSRGHIVTQETRDKIAKALKGREVPNERRIHISEGVQKALARGCVFGGNTRYPKGSVPWNKGKKGVYSKERMEQLREQALNRPKFKYGFKGKKHTPESLKKISEKSKGREVSIETRLKNRIALLGEKCHLWRGGKHKEEYKHYRNMFYRWWRESVFKRDDYACQFCGDRCGNGHKVFLHPHHIKSYTHYPEFRYDVRNGVTLCIKCHRELHSKNNEEIATKVLEYAKSRGWIEE